MTTPPPETGPATGEINLSSADAKLLGQASGDEVGYGVSVASAGDTNADGYDDIVVGARYNGNGGYHSGCAYLVLGPVSAGELSLAAADAILAGEAVSDLTGDSVAGPGDVDGDGRDDLLIGSGYQDAGASDGGAAYLVLGPVSGVRGLSTANARFTAAGANDRIRTHGAGDVDADGYADILVGAQNNSDNGTQSGAAYLFYGKGL